MTISFTCEQHTPRDLVQQPIRPCIRSRWVMSGIDKQDGRSAMNVCTMGWVLNRHWPANAGCLDTPRLTSTLCMWCDHLAEHLLVGNVLVAGTLNRPVEAFNSQCWKQIVVRV